MAHGGILRVMAPCGSQLIAPDGLESSGPIGIVIQHYHSGLGQNAHGLLQGSAFKTYPAHV